MAVRPVRIKHCGMHNTMGPITRARVGNGWTTFAAISKSIIQRLSTTTLAALGALAIATGRGYI